MERFKLVGTTMGKRLYVLLIIFFLSCNNDAADWLNQYKSLKCQYLTSEQQMNDSIQKTNALLQQEMNKVAESSKIVLRNYQDKVDLLQRKIKQSGEDFQREYKTETLHHSVKYGHVSTPDYEKRLKQLEAKRDNTIASCERNISLIRRSMESDPKAKVVIDRLNDFEVTMKKKENDIKMSFNKKLDSLQHELNNHNYRLREIVYELKQEEADKLKAQRDSIKLNPCR